VVFQAEHKDLLFKAIEAEKLQMEVRPDGRISLDYGAIVLDLGSKTAAVQDGYQNKLNSLKRAYSLQAINKVAKMNMWMNKRVTETKGLFVKF
jgi:hypothetical protein